MGALLQHVPDDFVHGDVGVVIGSDGLGLARRHHVVGVEFEQGDFGQPADGLPAVPTADREDRLFDVDLRYWAVT